MSPRAAPVLATADDAALPLWPVHPDGLDARLGLLSPQAAAWARAQGFAAGAGECLPLPGPDGSITGALVGLGRPVQARRGRFQASVAATRLPAGVWTVTDPPAGMDLTGLALGWLLESYRFDRYRAVDGPTARLACPPGVDRARVEAIAAAECLTRDLINTPAADMGPAEIDFAVGALATAHGAGVSVIAGDDLLARNFPMIHAVGRAAGGGAGTTSDRHDMGHRRAVADPDRQGRGV